MRTQMPDAEVMRGWDADDFDALLKLAQDALEELARRYRAAGWNDYHSRTIDLTKQLTGHRAMLRSAREVIDG